MAFSRPMTRGRIATSGPGRAAASTISSSNYASLEAKCVGDLLAIASLSSSLTNDRPSLGAVAEAEPGNECERDHGKHRNKCRGRPDIACVPDMTGTVGDRSALPGAGIKQRVAQT